MLKIDECLGANRPLIFTVAESDMEVLQHLDKKYKDHRFFVYSTTLAKAVPLPDLLKTHFQGTGTKARSATTVEVLGKILTKDFNTTNNKFETYIFLNADNYINDKQVIRRVKDIVSRYQLDEGFTVNMMFVSQTVDVPMDLERLAEVVFFDLPTEGECTELSEFLTTKLDLKDDRKKDKEGNVVSGIDRRPSLEVVNNLKGMTKFEIEQAYLQSFHIYKASEGAGRIDLEFIRNFKKNAIAKTNLLSLMESDVTFDDIGGLITMKEWIRKCYGGWTVEGKEFGLPLLKGLLMVGLSGCGKSLISKGIGNEWGLPVICFDPTRIFSSRVGDSEANMRRVLQIVENIAPCLHGDTRITLSDGSVTTIREMYEHEYRGLVPSFSSDFKVEDANVLLITKKESTDLYNLRTSVGNIKATGNHRFPVLRSNGELHWVRVDHIQEGDFIVAPRKYTGSRQVSAFDYVGEYTRIYSPDLCSRFLSKIKTEDPEYYRKHSRRIYGSGVKAKKFNGFVFKHEVIKYGLDVDMGSITKLSCGNGGYTDSTLNKCPSNFTDVMYALGLLWSDGNIGDKNYSHYDLALKTQKRVPYRTRNSNTTCFVNTCEELHEALRAIMGQEFGLELKTCGVGARTTYGIGVLASEMIRRLQKDLLSLDEDMVWAWLSGVMDGDGHVADNKIVFAAQKHGNNEYIRDALLRVGIPTSNPIDDFKDSRIEITSGPHIRLLKNGLQLRHPQKIEALETVVEGDSSRFDTLNVRQYIESLLIQKGLIVNDDPMTCKDKERHQTVLSASIPPTIRDMVHEYVDQERLFSVEKVQEIISECGGDPWFLKNSFFFAKVNEINPIHGVHDVYDLCLDKNHNFISNRLFTHNCILFIDEIEKGFAGMQSSTFSDSGVTARVIGSFLIWMQECKAPVFTVATSNAIHYMPPELIGRFDECFFVNMPQTNERKDIFSIHLKKLGRDSEKFDIDKLAEKSQDLSGREIEQVLKESMYDAFHDKTELTTDTVLKALTKKTSLLTTMGEQMSYLLKWVGWDPQKKDGVRARYASPVDEMNRARVMTEIDALLKEVGSKPIDPTGGLGIGGGGPDKC